MTTAAAREAGYAMVAAIAGMAILAVSALAIVNDSRGVAQAAAATSERARLSAAADAGLAIAVDKLVATRGERWSLDGRPHSAQFDTVRLDIVVSDERGKIPINQLSYEQTRTMLEAVGVSGGALDIAVDSLLDWIDDDDDVRPDGAEVDYYATRGLTPRNGALRSVGELMEVRGFTPATFAALRDEISLAADSANGFDDRFARPLALAVMSGNRLATPQAIARARELVGNQVAIELGEDESLVGRPLAITINAYGTGRARFRRSVIIELTGTRAPAYVVRQIG